MEIGQLVKMASNIQLQSKAANTDNCKQEIWNPTNPQSVDRFIAEQLNYSEEVSLITEEMANKFPYNCIGILLFSIDKDGDVKYFYGTGFLVGPDLVLTVAHNTCYLSNKERHQYGNLQFFAGISTLNYHPLVQQTPNMNKLNKLGIKVKSRRIPDRFGRQKNLQNDYALLKLQKRIQREEYIKLGTCYSPISQKLSIIYYENINEQDQFCLKTISRTNKHQITNKIRLQHSFKTTQGSSGAPILVQRQGKIFAIAIHKGILTKEKRKLIPQQQWKNVARMINDELIEALLRWEKQFYLEEYASHIQIYNIEEKSIKLKDFSLRIEEFMESIEREKNEKNKFQKECQILKQVIDQLIIKLQKVGAQKLHFQSVLLTQINPEQIKEIAQQKEFEVIEQSQETKSVIRIEQNNRSSLASPTILRESKQKTQLFNFRSQFWDLSSPFSNKYQIIKNRAILRHDDYTRYQLTSRIALINYSQLAFSIEQYGGQRDICFGIITENRKRCQYSGDSKDSLGFWCGRKGRSKIILDGEQIANEVQLYPSNFSPINMFVDLYEMNICFSVNSKPKKVNVKLPDSYKNKNLYLFVVLANKNDTISIFV